MITLCGIVMFTGMGILLGYNLRRLEDCFDGKEDENH